MPYAFTIIDENGRIIQNLENQIRIEADYTSIHLNENSSEILSIKRNSIKLNKCNIEDFGEYKSLFNFSKINQYFCFPINRQNLTLFGIAGDSYNPNSFIEIQIGECSDDFRNPELNKTIGCLNKNLIKKNLESFYFTSLLPDYDIDHSDVNTPGKLILRTEILQLSSSIFNRYYLDKKIVNYVSDFGFLIKNYFKQKYYQSDNFLHYSDLRPISDHNGIWGSITLSLSKKTDHHFRYYVKL